LNVTRFQDFDYPFGTRCFLSILLCIVIADLLPVDAADGKLDLYSP